MRRSRSKRKGFLLTIDALLALAIVSAATLATVVYSQGFDFSPASALNALGRDYLVLKNNGLAPDFKALTGFNAYDAKDGVPFGAPLVVHSEAYFYPKICGGVPVIAADSPCLQRQDLTPDNFRKEVWITP